MGCSGRNHEHQPRCISFTPFKSPSRAEKSDLKRLSKKRNAVVLSALAFNMSNSQRPDAGFIRRRDCRAVGSCGKAGKWRSQAAPGQMDPFA